MKKFDADQPGFGLAQLVSASGDVNSLLHSALMFTPEETTQPRSVYRNGGKRVLETLLIILSLPFFVPIVVLSMIALWIEGGNPFYRQIRLGQDGKRFSILKMRTMVRDADAVLEEYLASNPEMRREWDEKQKLINDPRVTRVGAALRTTSLDELPQLWNVLTGDMSLIGPRPMMPEQLVMYGNPSHYFALRPGVTGLWQISARKENRFSFRNDVDATYDKNTPLLGYFPTILKTRAILIWRTACEFCIPHI